MPPLVDFYSYPGRDIPVHGSPTPFLPSSRDSLSKHGQHDPPLPWWKGWVHPAAVRIGVDALFLAGLVAIKYLASPLIAELSSIAPLIPSPLPSIAPSRAAPYQPLEPPLPGLMPGRDRPRIVLGQDITFPPYAFLSSPKDGAEAELSGFAHDCAMGLQEVCDIEVTMVQTTWDQCWTSSNQAGLGLLQGHFHGCASYTHTAGERIRSVEFSHSILKQNKPAGLLTRLSVDGTPVVSPTDNLAGKRIVDVAGWAPTPEGIAIVANPCTGERYTGYKVLVPPESGNDAAMRMLLSGEADAMWVYADQAHNYACQYGKPLHLEEGGEEWEAWDCSLWDGLGTRYAYIATGLFNHAHNGTTLAMARRGSGLMALLNPCIKKFLETSSYSELCAKYGVEADCYRNAHFPEEVPAQEEEDSLQPRPWKTLTRELRTECADGYCPCPAPA